MFYYAPSLALIGAWADEARLRPPTELHSWNEFKAVKLEQVANPLRFATEEEIHEVIGAGPGSLGPVKLNIPCIADSSVAVMSDFAAGANQNNKHYFGMSRYGALTNNVGSSR